MPQWIILGRSSKDNQFSVSENNFLVLNLTLCHSLIRSLDLCTPLSLSSPWFLLNLLNTNLTCEKNVKFFVVSETRLGQLLLYSVSIIQCVQWARVFTSNSSRRRKVKPYRRIFWKRLHVWIEKSHRLLHVSLRILPRKWRILESPMPNEHPVCMSFGDCTHPQHQETTNVCHDTSMQRSFFDLNREPYQ